MKKLLLLIFLLGFGLQVSGQHVNKYCNSAFPFCVDIPGNFARQGESKTGNGQWFKAKDGSVISVYGSFNSLNEPIKERFEREQNKLTSDTTVANTTQLPIIEKAELQEHSFIIIYQEKNTSNLIFRKLENNVWKSIEMQYPTAKAKEYLEVSNRVIGSLK